MGEFFDYHSYVMPVRMCGYYALLQNVRQCIVVNGTCHRTTRQKWNISVDCPERKIGDVIGRCGLSLHSICRLNLHCSEFVG